MAEPLVLLNYAFVAVVFSLLLGAMVSQRARVGLCWVAIPGLVACVGTKLLRTYDTVDELTFYASYHSHPMNQLVHIVCVPLLLFTVLHFRGLRATADQVDTATDVAAPRRRVRVVAAPRPRRATRRLYCVLPHVRDGARGHGDRRAREAHRDGVALSSSIVERSSARDVLEPVQFAGNVGTVVKRNIGSVVVRLEGSNVSLEALHSQLRGFGECRAGDRVRTLGAGTYGFAAFYAGLVHVFCWYAPIHPGHGIYEGRKPALLDAAPSSPSSTLRYCVVRGRVRLRLRPGPQAGARRRR